MSKQLKVLIDPGHLFILRVAAQGFINDHPGSPNAPNIRDAITAAVEAIRSAREVTHE